MKFGIAVDNVGRTDLTLLLMSNLTKSMAANAELCPSVFFREIAPALGVIPCPIFSFNELWCFTHDVMATSYETAKLLLDISGPKKLYYYVHELPQVTSDDYFRMSAVLNNERLNLLCRSDLHKTILKNNYLKGDKDVKIVNEESLFDDILGITTESKEENNNV